jgi:hypothetical protein
MQSHTGQNHPPHSHLYLYVGQAGNSDASLRWERFMRIPFDSPSTT